MISHSSEGFQSEIPEGRRIPISRRPARRQNEEKVIFLELRLFCDTKVSVLHSI